MQIDSKISFEESSTSRDHRSRTQSAATASPAHDTAEQPIAGGATPVSRAELGPTRDGTAEDRPAPETAQEPTRREREARHDAERMLERMLDLPADTRLGIEVDREQQTVRFQLRDRDTGVLIREIPEREAQPLVEKLREFSGALVDRQF